LQSTAPRQGPAKPLFSLGTPADVILEVTPISVKYFGIDSSVDAIEEGHGKISETADVVLFSIEKCLRGEFTRVSTGGSSKMDQAQEAFKNQEYLKILIMDFQQNKEMTQKGWISVAVNNSEKTFAIKDRSHPGNGRYRLYLNRVPQRSDSYVMIKSVKVA
jgi:hypothetical protein